MFEKKVSGIEELKGFVMNEAPAIASRCSDYDAYLREVRVPLNYVIISLTVGGTIKTNKKGVTQLHFNRSLPNREEINEIRKTVDTFIVTVEKPFMSSMNEEQNDDMEVPLNDEKINIPKMDKATGKNFRGYVFGNEGKCNISKMLLNGNDVNELAAIGEQMRKKRNLHIAMIIGGISLVAVTGGAVAGVVIHNKKKKDGLIVDDVDMIDIDEDIDPVDTVDTSADADIPAMVKLA